VHDRQGSVIAVLNASGQTTSTYAYNEFGQSAQDGQTGSPYRYAGMRYDEIGLYVTPNRTYVPGIGRWLQMDPAGFADGLNRYAYVTNNPLSGMDPTGLFCLAIMGECKPQPGTSTIPLGIGEMQIDSEEVQILTSAATLLVPGEEGAGVRGLARSSGKIFKGIERSIEKERFVYRGLAKGEDPAVGLTARAPDAGNSEISHVAGKRESQWISTTKSMETATEKYGENGAVRIDLNKVGSEISDISGGFPQGGRMSNWSVRDQEVLIKNYIPPDAIQKVK
ncbi:RHS repeat domain-containing protein, partial [Azospirillum sp. B4]|uniref:RHS repeat domain-containing protein n=1 Tax=Azospirillum sp. B4 TaxID=95605 RepID=UPI001B3B84D6